MNDDLVTWKGTPVEELTREELLDALKIMGRLYKNALDNNLATSRMWADICRAKGGYGRYPT